MDYVHGPTLRQWLDGASPNLQTKERVFMVSPSTNAPTSTRWGEASSCAPLGSHRGV